MSERLAHWSRRSPVTHASRPSSAPVSASPSPNRSIAHSSRCHGSWPSNSTASSPTSSSSNSSTLTAHASLTGLECSVTSSRCLCFDVSSLARRRRHAGERCELLVGRACCERGERLALAAPLDPAGYEAADDAVEVFGGDPSEEGTPDRLVGTQRATHVDLVRL